MILAGGQGSRLGVLSETRAKPAVPFAGQYRIIDFALSNALHSDLPLVGILTQYRPYSLMEHLRHLESWGFTGRGRMGSVLPPYRGHTDSSWYAGTADAIYQNLNFLKRFDCDVVLVLSGDHIYRMDYRKMLQFHVDHEADLTVACQPVPWEETSRFGVMKTKSDDRIVAFQEKPKKDPVSNLASLGIYVFNAKMLHERLQEDASRRDSAHDFGNDIIPRMIQEDHVYCYEFRDYWRDVGTLDSYWEANMEALDPASGLDLAAWDVRTNMNPSLVVSHRPARILPLGTARNSLVSKGCMIEGLVEQSVVSQGVIVRAGARVTRSVILDDCVIGEGAVVENAILDKRVIVGRRAQVGLGSDSEPNRNHPDLLSGGLTVIGKAARLPAGVQVGRNVLICSGAQENDFDSQAIESGACVGEHSS